MALTVFAILALETRITLSSNTNEISLFESLGLRSSLDYLSYDLVTDDHGVHGRHIAPS